MPRLSACGTCFLQSTKVSAYHYFDFSCVTTAIVVLFLTSSQICCFGAIFPSYCLCWSVFLFAGSGPHFHSIEMTSAISVTNAGGPYNNLIDRIYSIIIHS